MAAARDLTLRLPNGTDAHAFASFTSFGSPTVRELLARTDASGLTAPATAHVPLDVSRAGFLLALDELLPPYLRTTRPIEAFNPFKKTHRDFIHAIRYLRIPHAAAIEDTVPLDAALTQVNKEGLVFIAANPGRLTHAALGALFAFESDGRVSFTTAAAVELLRVSCGDDEATRAFQLSAGRAVFAAMEKASFS